MKTRTFCERLRQGTRQFVGGKIDEVEARQLPKDIRGMAGEIVVLSLDKQERFYSPIEIGSRPEMPVELMYSSSRLVRLPTESGIWPPRPGRLPNWRLLTLVRLPRVGGRDLTLEAGEVSNNKGL